MDTILTPAYTNQIHQLMSYVHAKDFRQAEELVLSLVDTVLTHDLSEQKEQVADLLMLTVLYEKFNDVYLVWIHANDLPDPTTHLQSLVSDDHENCLIAHCSAIAEMDDLLYEAMQYVMEKSTKEEVKKHVGCYRSLIQKT